ncbi:MAG: hypothetical protein OEL79_07830 [Chromatiales bacterium]|nr:hypothetical protein [Chromatiales bacterium]
MNKPTKILLAMCISIAFGTLHADELDEITMGVINESDISVDDVAQTIKIPSAEQLKKQIRIRTNEESGQGALERNRFESGDQEQNSEMDDAKQEMESEQDALEEEKHDMEQEQKDSEASASSKP